MSEKQTIWLGFDPRPHEVVSFAVARNSIRRRLGVQLPVRGLVLRDLQADGLYTRPTSVRDNKLWDDISQAPMSTEFALSRFLVPFLADGGWALFADADMMARTDLRLIFREAHPDKAVMVVKHPAYLPKTETKMDGQMQTVYPRKNWSSVVLWNVDHPANSRLSMHMVNTAKGLWLHQFGWLKDDEIGELHPRWNHLVGYSKKTDKEPGLVHFTDGVPSMPGYEGVEYADEWRREVEIWASR